MLFLGAAGEMDFDVTVTGSQPGKVDHTLKCHVHHLDEPLMLHIEAEIKVGQILTSTFVLINSKLIVFGQAHFM